MAKGKDSSAPPIANGSWVAWDGGKGRVDLVVNNGKVPGIEDDVEGTDKTPAARVVVYENGKATRRKIGMSTAKLRRTPPIKGAKSATGGDALVERLAAHEETVEELGLPTHTRVSGRAVKAVYERGLDSWPGEDVTTLTAEEWALGRVDHFIKAAQGGIETKAAAGHDTDLLDREHPLATDDEPSDDEPVLWDGAGLSPEDARIANGEPAGAADWTARSYDQGGTVPDAPAAPEAPVDAPDDAAPDEDTSAADEDDVEGKSIVLDRAAVDAQLAELLGSVD